jgi:hypothetical protein
MTDEVVEHMMAGYAYVDYILRLLQNEGIVVHQPGSRSAG